MLKGEDTLRLSSGDSWSGARAATAYDGENAVAVMNRMGYDAMALGNHELDFGLPVLQMRVQRAAFPILSAIMRYAADNSTPIDLGHPTLHHPRTGRAADWHRRLDISGHPALLHAALQHATGLHGLCSRAAGGRS